MILQHHTAWEKASLASERPSRCCACWYAHVRKAARCHCMSHHNKGTDSDSDKSSAYPLRYTSALLYARSVSYNSASGS